ncbi:tetratricopeptide repeat protein [Bosea sp. R86505]|uniref:tetratricopeptide repeat protein n=1 Tax=Bosea sp. R86505 TaxID=3101710 RepID=UPI00366F2BCF
MIDAFGSEHATGHTVAVAAFAAAVKALASHRPHASMHLEAALNADPGLTAAHALSGLADVILASEDHLAGARAKLARGRAALAANDGGTGFERALVTALDHAVEGRLRAAGDSLDDYLYGDPNAFVAAKLSHAFRFLIGDADGMVSLTARLSVDCEPGNAGYGYLLGCHAFGLEEVGRLHEAERVGRRALELCPDDAWGLHAVAHVYEMRGQTADGIAWLEGNRLIWSRCNNFSRHVAWHLALFELEKGDHDAVLAVYDRDIANDLSGDCRDFANAASILWRLRQLGVDPGSGRWNALAAVGDTHARSATLVFAQLHVLIAQIAAGRLDEASDMAELIHDRSRTTTDQANVARNVGSELAHALLQSALSGGQQAPVGLLARRLHRLGGSHAQRDVFLRSLALIARDSGDVAGLRQVLAVRRRNKADDSFVAHQLALTATSTADLAARAN